MILLALWLLALWSVSIVFVNFEVTRRIYGLTRRQTCMLLRNVVDLKFHAALGRLLNWGGIDYSFQCALCSRRFPMSNCWNHVTWCCKQLRELQ